MWRGSGLPTEPLGHDDFVTTHLQECFRSHQILLDRIPKVTDLQTAWALLPALRLNSCELYVARSQT